MSLDSIHHIALHVADLEVATKWYETSFKCERLYADRSQAVLQFHNIQLVLVLPSSEQPHVAFLKENAETFGELFPTKTGESSTVVSDPTGNIVELVKG